MKLKTRIFRATNKLLSAVNLEVKPVGSDLDSRLADGPVLDRTLAEMTRLLQDWFAEQTMFEATQPFTVADTRAFYDAYLDCPFRKSFGGSRFNNLLSLYAITKVYNPTTIVDSGTFQGASAWAFARASSSARILSYDIDMTRLIHREPRVEYIAHDWATPLPTFAAGERTLAYFDDHVDQCQRLLEASRAGIDVAVFDDDFSTSTFMPFAHGGFSLPKVEFALDDHLRSIDQLTWVAGGKSLSWPVDVDYLDRARATIADTDRLPDGSNITGLGQLPYRVVKMASQAMPVS